MILKLVFLLLLPAISSFAWAEDSNQWLKKSPSEEWEEFLINPPDNKTQNIDKNFQEILDQAYVKDPELQKIAKTYRESCILKIEQKVKKKILPNRRGEGALTFNILSNGKVNGVEVVETSGDQILDEAMKHAVYLASPFEPFPTEMQTYLEITDSKFRYMRMDVKFIYTSPTGSYPLDRTIMR